MRFVGNDVDDDNQRCLLPWVKKVKIWQSEGKDVYFFCHRPDNKDAPWLAQQFIDLYNNTTPSLALNNLSIKTQPEQNSLFWWQATDIAPIDISFLIDSGFLIQR